MDALPIPDTSEKVGQTRDKDNIIEVQDALSTIIEIGPRNYVESVKSTSKDKWFVQWCVFTLHV